MSPTLSTTFQRGNDGADALLEKLQDPQVVKALGSLLEKSHALNDFLEHGEDLLNSMTKGIGQLGRASAAALGKSLDKVDLDDLKSASGELQGVLPLLRDFIGELKSLREAGFFDPEVVKVLARTGRAMSAAARDPEAHSDEGRGIFGMTGLLKEPEIARTLNFIISFARHFGSDPNLDGVGSAKNKT